MSNKRIAYIDILEVIAIYFICFIHYPILRTNWFCNFIDCLAYTGVIVFLMVNGALLFNKEFDLKKHLKKMLSLAIGLVCWEVISIFYFANLYHLDLNTIKINDAISYMLGGIRWTMPTGHFWFIITLLAIYSIFPILKMVFDNEKYGRKFLLFFVGYSLVFNFLVNDLNTLQLLFSKLIGNFTPVEWSLLNKYSILSNDRIYYSLTLFIIGGLLHKYLYVDKKVIKNQKLVGVFFILLGWCLLYISKGIHTGFTGSDFTNLPGAYGRICAVILGIGWFLSFVNVRDFKLKIIEVISKNTLGIFYLHCLFLGAISYYLYPYIYPCCLSNVIKSIIVLFLSLLICVLAEQAKNIFNMRITK